MSPVETFGVDGTGRSIPQDVTAKNPWRLDGERGYISAALLARRLPTPYADHEYFVCGLDPMMDAIEKALGELELPKSKYHPERYSFV